MGFNMIGREMALDDSLSALERAYVRLFGAPISGFRIRYRRLMPVLRRLIREVDPAGEGGSGLSILDLGCGTGLFSYALARAFPECRILGVDNVAELVDKNNGIAARAGLDNCRFQVRDALDLDFEDEFDLVLCIDNLEHIEDDETVLGHIHQALKGRGLALIHVPGLYRRWFLFSKKTNFDVSGHVRPGYILEDIRAKTVRAGFSLLESYYTYGWLETVTNNVSYLITGAERRNKHIYALVFPLLNALAFFGQWSRPAWGAGLVVAARKG